jgi:hypothetical protein
MIINFENNLNFFLYFLFMKFPKNIIKDLFIISGMQAKPYIFCANQYHYTDLIGGDNND